MEEFKDVMLSEPPPRMDPSGGYRSYENYKGILLCDRPSDHRMVVGVAEQPFLPAGRPERDLFGMPGRDQEGCLGLQPSLEAVNRHNIAKQARMENSKNVAPTALSKHRKWLKALSNETKKMRMDEIETQLEKEARVKRFQESEKKKRDAMRRGAAADGVQCADVLRNGKKDPTALDMESEHSSPVDREPEAAKLDMHETSSLPDIPRGSPAATSQPADEAGSEKGEKTPGSKGIYTSTSKKKKPKWAMTEEEAFDAEMEEAKGLVDFAMKLDYDKFIEDYEVREALRIMRERVEEIAEEQGLDPEYIRSPRTRADDTRSVASTAATESSQQRRERRAKERDPQQISDKDWDTSSNAGTARIRKAIDADALRLAEHILAKSEALKQIHSRASLGKLLQDIAINKNIPIPATTDPPKTIPHAPPCPEPMVANVSAQATGKERRILNDLKHSKEYVQNLPYLYRCPSI
eukprot:Sspe_Gene.83260::Locus_54614_Transcript_1_1_Confidence_1.000_Length_1724::g.83260::m.83260